MTHPIRRVVTGARREGPRGRHLRWSGPVRARQQARPDWFSVDIWRARDAGQDRCKPPSAGPGWVVLDRRAGIVVRARWSAEFWSSQGMTPSQLF